MAVADVVGLILKKQKGRVAHLNVREEMHGEEAVLAVDVKCVLEMGNKVLDQLSPGMRSAFYAKDGVQADLEEDHLTALRWPQLGKLKFSPSGMENADFTVHAAKKDDDLSFNGDVSDIVLELKEGGTVEVTFSVSVHPSPEINGELSAFLGKKDCKFSLRPVEQAGQPPLES